VIEGTAVVVTAEDSFDAVHRRLNRIDPTARRLRHPNRMIVLPLPDAGGPRPLVATNSKALARTPFLNDLMRRAWQALDRAAHETGAQPLAPQVWECVLPSTGEIISLVRSEEEAHHVARECRVFTVAEVAILIEALGEGVLSINA
jgi:hypothetical protein